MRLRHLHQVAARRGDATAALEFYRNTLGARFVAEFDPPGLLFFDFAGTLALASQVRSGG